MIEFFDRVGALLKGMATGKPSREQLESRLAQAAGLLARVEWAATYSQLTLLVGEQDPDTKACPVCHNGQHSGHTLSCKLDRWFREDLSAQ